MASGSGDGFARHVREAIELNQARLPLYAALTDGRSVTISRRLIRIERCTLVAAWYVDRRARPFQAEGIGIGSDEFVPISGAPAFSNSFDPPKLRDYRAEDSRGLSGALRTAWERGGFHGIRDASDREIARLAREPRFHCMVRHLLESVRRVADLAPRHEAAARDAGLTSTRPLSELMLRLHLLGFGPAVKLDHIAAPLQAEGVPILFQDLPPIPLEP